MAKIGRQGDGGGQPKKSLNEDQVREVETLGALLSLDQIADYFGMARNTFTAICERQPEVLERYKKGKAKAIGAVAKGLLQQAREGNMTAAIFYLKTQAGWRETTVQEITGKDGAQIVVVTGVPE
jgi:hypothetical protein